MSYLIMIIFLLVIVFISVLPAIFIGKYIYKKDKDKEPKNLIIKLLIFGVLSAFLAIVLIEFYNFLFPSQNTFFTILCSYTIGVGLSEEFSKFLPAYFVGIKSKYFDDVYDAIFYTTFSALGFAAFENIFYVLSGGIATSLLRFFISVPSHISYAVIMGYFIGIAYKYKSNGDNKQFIINMFYSIFIPSLFHGLYDFGLAYGAETSNLFTILVSIVVSIILIIYAIVKVKNISVINEKIDANNLKNRNVGLKFILFGIVIVFLMVGFSKINFLNCLNMYTINDTVNIKEHSFNIKVVSYEEITVSNENYIKVDIKLQNTSSNLIIVDLSNFKLMDNSYNYLEQNNIDFTNVLPNTINANQNITGSLYFKKNMSNNQQSKYALVYNASKEYSIIFAEGITDFIMK